MAGVQKHGNGWRGVYDIPVPEGAKRAQRKTKTHAKKKDALQEALDQEAAIRGGTWFDDRPGKMTFSTYFEQHWKPNRVAELNTRKKWQSHYNAAKFGLKKTWGHRELMSITNSDVQGWVAQMIEAGMSPATIEGRFGTFQTVLAARKGASALRDRKIQYDPCQGVQIPQRPLKRVLFYEPDQVWDLCDELGDWWAPVALFASETGMRWGELAGLRVRDFTLGHRAVRVERVIVNCTIAESGNGTPYLIKDYPKEGPYGDGVPKTVTLDQDMQDLVGSLIARRGLGPDDLLFAMPNKAGLEVTYLNPRPPKGKQPDQVENEDEWTVLRTSVWPGGYPMSDDYYREQIWKPAIARAGVPVRKFHSLRASHITWMLSAGNDLTVVMDRVGHRLFTTTRRYAGVMDEANREAVNKLSDFKAKYRQRRTS